MERHRFSLKLNAQTLTPIILKTHEILKFNFYPISNRELFEKEKSENYNDDRANYNHKNNNNNLKRNNKFSYNHNVRNKLRYNIYIVFRSYYTTYADDDTERSLLDKYFGTEFLRR